MQALGDLAWCQGQWRTSGHRQMDLHPGHYFSSWFAVLGPRHGGDAIRNSSIAWAAPAASTASWQTVGGHRADGSLAPRRYVNRRADSMVRGAGRACYQRAGACSVGGTFICYQVCTPPPRATWRCKTAPPTFPQRTALYLGRTLAGQTWASFRDTLADWTCHGAFKTVPTDASAAGYSTRFKNICCSRARRTLMAKTLCLCLPPLRFSRFACERAYPHCTPRHHTASRRA